MGETNMASGDRKKGRENKKPKQDAKAASKSAYQSSRDTELAKPFKIKK
jgi:hypothetical protein